MTVNSVISGNSFNFSSIANIRKQADAIKQRTAATRKARMEQQEKTGLIQNPDTGEMVPLSSVSEEQREKWNDRADLKTISLNDAYILFSASDPNAEEVERSKQLGAKYAKIQEKMLAGKKLSGEEKSFLREHYPSLAAMADRMEYEAEQLERNLQKCKSEDEERQVYMDAKMKIMSGTNKKDGSIMFLSVALDKAYSKHKKRGSSSDSQIDLWA